VLLHVYEKKRTATKANKNHLSHSIGNVLEKKGLPSRYLRKLQLALLRLKLVYCVNHHKKASAILSYLQQEVQQTEEKINNLDNQLQEHYRIS